MGAEHYGTLHNYGANDEECLGFVPEPNEEPPQVVRLRRGVHFYNEVTSFTNMIQEAAAQLNDWVNLLTLWCNNQNLANGFPEAGDNVAFTFTCAKRRSFIGIATDLYIIFNYLPKENIITRPIS